jgi:hypothetical protein
MKDAPETPGDFDMILQNAEGIKQIYFSNPEVEQNNAILEETFADAINTINSYRDLGTSHRSITSCVSNNRLF